MVTDPKALNYILHKAPYHFQRPPEVRGMIQLFNGEGLANVEGSSLF
jgi:hypothetical protein